MGTDFGIAPGLQVCADNGCGRSLEFGELFEFIALTVDLREVLEVV